MKNKKTEKRKVKQFVPAGKAVINSTFNNTIVTITCSNGNVISWSSAGKKGFKGSKKSTPYAAQVAAEDAGRAAMEYGLQRLTDVIVKGPGQGRETAVRALQGLGLVIVTVVDLTPVPHNGCRPPKRRRV